MIHSIQVELVGGFRGGDSIKPMRMFRKRTLPQVGQSFTIRPCNTRHGHLFVKCIEIRLGSVEDTFVCESAPWEAL